jgi:hypothetical protein
VLRTALSVRKLQPIKKNHVAWRFQGRDGGVEGISGKAVESAHRNIAF